MEKTNVLTLIITLVVGVILCGALLGPVVDDATATDGTFKNEGLWRMKEIENGDIWTRTTSGWSFGDEAIQAAGASNLILGDDWCIRAVGHLRSTADANANTNLTNATVTAGESLIVASKTDSTWSRNLDYPGYGADPNGDYAITPFEGTAYVKGDSVIYGSGVSELSGVQVFVHVEATVDGGATFTVSQSAGQYAISDVVVSNPTVNREAVDGYLDLYKLNNVTCDVSFTATIEGTDTPITGTINFSSYVVPYEVTAERAVHLDNGQIALMGTIPIMVIVALLMAAVGAIALRRND